MMRKLALLFIFLVLWAHAAGAEAIITVEVNKSGNSLWTLEKRVPLTQPEINEWEAAIKAGQNMSRYRDIAEFQDMISLFLRSAKNFSNRSMEVEKFNVSYDTVKTMSGGFGIIRYSFRWMNFSRTDSEKIWIGDAFPEGMALSTDSVLVIKIPDGYDVKSVSPNFDKRDGNRLIWDGTTYRNFGKGEPALVLMRAGSTWLITVVFLVILAAGAAMFWRIRRSRHRAGNGGAPAHITEPAENNTESYNIDAVLKPPISLPSPEEEDLGDEEMIEQFLIRSGGQAYQSDIVKESRLSKSKISMVLAKMKEEGQILKIKKGKENLIRLVRK